MKWVFATHSHSPPKKIIVDIIAFQLALKLKGMRKEKLFLCLLVVILKHYQQDKLAKINLVFWISFDFKARILYLFNSSSWAFTRLCHWNSQLVPDCCSTVFRGGELNDVNWASYKLHQDYTWARIQDNSTAL